MDSTVQGADSGAPGSDSGLREATPSRKAAGPCPVGMVLIATYCIDPWEAYVVELDDAGAEPPHSPYDVVDGLTVRAKTAGGVVPRQGYISQVQATHACANAGKRLCTVDEFHLACEGPSSTNWYPYGGETHIPGYCNEGKGSMMPILFGNNAANWTYADFNDPRLNQIDGGLAPTASYPHCESPYGIFDCVGNLHEWGSDAPDANGHGRFRGGFYGDAEINGHGCLYVTSAHELELPRLLDGLPLLRGPAGTSRPKEWPQRRPSSDRARRGRRSPRSRCGARASARAAAHRAAPCGGTPGRRGRATRTTGRSSGRGRPGGGRGRRERRSPRSRTSSRCAAGGSATKSGSPVSTVSWAITSIPTGDRSTALLPTSRKSRSRTTWQSTRMARRMTRRC